MTIQDFTKYTNKPLVLAALGLADNLILSQKDALVNKDIAAAQLEDALVSIKQELSTTNAQVIALSDEIAVANTTIGELNSQITVLTSDDIEDSDTITFLSEKLTSVNAEKVALEGTLADANAVIAEMESDIAVIESKIATFGVALTKFITDVNTNVSTFHEAYLILLGNEASDGSSEVTPVNLVITSTSSFILTSKTVNGGNDGYTYVNDPEGKAIRTYNYGGFVNTLSYSDFFAYHGMPITPGGLSFYNAETGDFASLKVGDILTVGSGAILEVTAV